jgi:hypothetical protein
MATTRDRLELNLIIADTPHEKGLAELALEAYDRFAPRVPEYRRDLLDMFSDASKIKKPRALWIDYK